MVVVCQGREEMTDEEAYDVQGLHAVAAWRATQGIYRLHPSLYEALLETEMDWELPAHLFERLPEWCVYVETPGLMFLDMEARGFFAFINHYDSDKPWNVRNKLSILVDLIGEETLYTVELDMHGTILDSIKRFEAEMAPTLWDNPPKLAEETLSTIAEDYGKLVALVLYLCADEADYVRRPLPQQRIVQGRKRPLIPCPPQPTYHPLGARMGTALDLARARWASSTEPGGGRSAEPHIRRAHYHRFWTGPRSQPDLRRLVVKWLPPIPVNLDGPPKVATIRPVLGSEP